MSEYRGRNTNLPDIDLSKQSARVQAMFTYGSQVSLHTCVSGFHLPGEARDARRHVTGENLFQRRPQGLYSKMYISLPAPSSRKLEIRLFVKI